MGSIIFILWTSSIHVIWHTPHSDTFYVIVKELQLSHYINKGQTDENEVTCKMSWLTQKMNQHSLDSILISLQCLFNCKTLCLSHNTLLSLILQRKYKEMDFIKLLFWSPKREIPKNKTFCFRARSHFVNWNKKRQI